MRRRTTLALLLLPLLIVGCGGGGGGDNGCNNSITYAPDPALSGRFTATFTPIAGETDGTTTFAFTLTDDGKIAGTSTRSGTTVVAVGLAGQVATVCGTTGTGLTLAFVFGSSSRDLTVLKGTSNVLTGSYNGVMTRSDGAQILGTFVVTAVAAG